MHHLGTKLRAGVNSMSEQNHFYPWADRLAQIVECCPQVRRIVTGPPQIIDDIKFGEGYSGEPEREDGLEIGTPKHLLLYGKLISVRMNSMGLPVVLAEHPRVDGLRFFLYGNDFVLDNFPAVPLYRDPLTWETFFDAELQSKQYSMPN